jgi:hypothetical protein
MSAERAQFKSSYGAFVARERELARNRARRDARDAAPDAGSSGDRPPTPADRPSP